MKLLSIAALLLLNMSLLFAQDAIKVEAVNRNMSQGEQPGFAVLLPKADIKTVENGWTKAVEGRGKAKTEKVNNEWVIRNTVISAITQDTITVYARTIATTEGVVLEVYVKDSTGFIGKDRSMAHPQAQKFVSDFAHQQHKTTVENQLSAAKDVLKSLEKESSSLSKDLQKLNSGVTKNTMGVNDNVNQISTNEADQERVRQQIQAQKQKVIDAGKLSPEAKKAEEKNLKTLEKELSKLMKEKEKLLQANVKNNSGIRDSNQEIKNKEVEIDNKQKQIAEQKGKIKELEDELRKLK
jgi:chromosome segregation ATPase